MDLQIRDFDDFSYPRRRPWLPVVLLLIIVAAFAVYRVRGKREKPGNGEVPTETAEPTSESGPAVKLPLLAARSVAKTNAEPGGGSGVRGGKARELSAKARALESSGDLLGAREVKEALHQYRAAAEMAPEIGELPFWHAVTLADLGRVDEALPIFRDVFARNAGWATLLPRLPQAGLLRDDPEMMRRILALAP